MRHAAAVGKSPTRITGLALATVLAAFPAAAQTLYKCVQPGGRVAYQDSPCGDAARQSTVRAPDAPPPRPLPPGDERANQPPQVDLKEVVNVLSSYQGCAQDVPGFAAKHSIAFNEWRNRNSSALASYGRDARAQEEVRERLDRQMKEASTDPDARAERAAACEREAAGWFGART
jgi:hypothetical protein